MWISGISIFVIGFMMGVGAVVWYLKSTGHEYHGGYYFVVQADFQTSFEGEYMKHGGAIWKKVDYDKFLAEERRLRESRRK